MLNHENWEYDLYLRIDEVVVFTGSVKTELVTEIKWCYRLGYIDESHRDMLMDYLDYKIRESELIAESRHRDNMERIKRNQEILRLQSEERKSIKELFLTLR